MAKAAKNKKSILLEGVEVFYHERTDSLNIVSTDPDLPKGQFFMKIKEGTPTDIALRKLFTEKTGNTKPLGKDLTSDLPQETVTLTDIDLRKNYDKYTFPIGVTKDRKPVTFEINKDDYTTNILISGLPGCGKTVLTEQIIRKAEISGIPVLKWEAAAGHERGRFGASVDKEIFLVELEELCSGDQNRTEPTLVIIDGLEHYLCSRPELLGETETLNQWRESVAELVSLLRMARSKNITFIMTEYRPNHELMSMISPLISMNIVGKLDTVASAIVSGTNRALKLKNGNFIVKTGQETKGMKAYHPAMKSDWV